jgi:hypothetical protein
MKNSQLKKSDGEMPKWRQASPEWAGTSALPDGNGGFTPCPELLTEEELVAFLRIPEVSNAADYHNVIENLKRMHGLPRIHICGKPLYPLQAIQRWIEEKTTKGK